MCNKQAYTLSRKKKIVRKPPYNRAGCIVELYNASRQPKFQKLVKVDTFMCARSPAPHVACGRKRCKCMASLYKHMGKLQRAVILILRRESKFLKVKFLHSIHSTHPCKNYIPKCSQFPNKLIKHFFPKSRHTKQKKAVQKHPHSQAGCIVEP